MTGKRREDGRACRCDQHDASCVGLTVGRLSSERVAELAEEIWTASTGRVLPARPIQDPRSSRPGASAQAAYQRRRQQELRAWLHGWWWRVGAVVGAAAGVDLLVGLTSGRLAGLAHGPSSGAGRRVAATLPTLRQRQRVAPAGRSPAPHGERATAPGAAGRPGPARRHPAGMASQPGASGDRLDRRVGHPVLPAWPAATAAHGDLAAMAGTRRHGRCAAQAALAGGSLRRHAGQRGVAPRAAAAVRPRWPAGGQPVG